MVFLTYIPVSNAPLVQKVPQNHVDLGRKISTSAARCSVCRVFEISALWPTQTWEILKVLRFNNYIDRFYNEIIYPNFMKSKAKYSDFSFRVTSSKKHKSNLKGEILRESSFFRSVVPLVGKEYPSHRA